MKKKSVVFVVYHLVCGGVESALFDLVHLLDKQKYDITVFCIYGGGEWEQKFLDAGIHVVSSYSQIKNITNPFLRVANSIRARRINYALAHGGKNLLKWATGKTYDIVVAYHIGSEFHDICFSNEKKSIKYVHGSAATNIELHNNLAKPTSRLSDFDKIICVSKNVQADLLSVASLTNTCYCYNPIDVSALDFKAAQSLPDNFPERYICAVGRLAPIKGFVRLISCFQKVLHAGIDAKLVIVGEGPERQSIEAAIRSASVEDSVILTGYSDNPYPYIKNALFLVCSSFSEGMPVTIMESLCLGVPIVSSYKHADELFGALPCGIVTDTDNDSLTQGLLEMFTSACQINTSNASHRRREYFSGTDLIKEVEKIFDSI